MIHATLRGELDPHSPSDPGPNEWRVLNELASYQGIRQRIGTTNLKTDDVDREVIIWSLDDGEHVVMLLHRKRIFHWEPTREPYEHVHARACDWLTEPAPQLRQMLLP